MSVADGYLLNGLPAEVERLRLQARTWEPEVETMLETIGIEPGWRCMDAGCGPMGIIGPLARRTGSGGVVMGIDHDAAQLEAAREYVAASGWQNVELERGDLFKMDLPRASFDLVHARFVLAPLGREQELLDQFTGLVRQAGIIVLQEPDAITWRCDPPSAAWDCLKEAVLDAFTAAGGDFSAGVRLEQLLRGRGVKRVEVRSKTLTLAGTHPYSRLLLQFARLLRSKIVSRGRLTEVQIQEAIQRCEEALEDPGCSTHTFRLVQAWGAC